MEHCALVDRFLCATVEVECFKRLRLHGALVNRSGGLAMQACSCTPLTQRWVNMYLKRSASSDCVFA